MAEILVISKQHDLAADPEKNIRAVGKPGEPAVIFEDGNTWGDEERDPAYFYILKLPGVAKATVEYLIKGWDLKVAYTILRSTLSTDVHRIRIAATTHNVASGEGKITRAMVEAFLTNWGATGITVADNAVEFDIGILNAFKGGRFWRADPLGSTGLVFTETTYTQSSGVHRVRIDYTGRLIEYTADPAKKAQFLKFLQLETTFISDNTGTKRAIVEIGRVNVRDKFQEDVRQSVGRNLRKHRYRFTDATVAQFAAAGGVLTMTQAEALAALTDKATLATIE